MPDIGWLLFAYVAGTGMGWYFAQTTRIQGALEDFLDNLIEQGYIKTKGTGDNLEILKHWEKDDRNI